MPSRREERLQAQQAREGTQVSPASTQGTQPIASPVAEPRRGSGGNISSKAAGILGSMREDIRSLSSSVLIITQKMKYLVRNEKILGRNLIVLNKKIKTLEDRLSAGEFSSGGGLGGAEGAQLIAKLDENNKKILELQAQLTQLSENVASQEQIQELKYVIDSIHPLEFATIRQVKDLIEESKKRK
jgi:vacuolar-type H+-ATPase subunit I/STV1